MGQRKSDAPFGDVTDSGGGKAEGGFVTGKNDVAVSEEGHAETDGGSVDGGNHRLGEHSEGQNQVPGRRNWDTL